MLFHLLPTTALQFFGLLFQASYFGRDCHVGRHRGKPGQLAGAWWRTEPQTPGHGGQRGRERYASTELGEAWGGNLLSIISPPIGAWLPHTLQDTKETTV